MIKDYTILEVSWGQYTELRPGEIYKGKEKASKTLKEMMKEEKKYITIIHYSFHWSFAIIDNIKKRISTYDSGVQISGSHSKPNEALKASLESIREEKRSNGKWNKYRYPSKMKEKVADTEC